MMEHDVNPTTGRCVRCGKNAFNRGNYPNCMTTIEKRRAKGRAQYWKNIDRNRMLNRERDRRAYPKVGRDRKLKRLGWTLERFVNARTEQDNKCAICKIPFTEERSYWPYADHKHIVPPEPRGLLCNACNLGLGRFSDDPTKLEAAAAYLRSWEKISA